MKPSLAVDEMFPEGAGSYMDVEEVISSEYYLVVSGTLNKLHISLLSLILILKQDLL